MKNLSKELEKLTNMMATELHKAISTLENSDIDDLPSILTAKLVGNLIEKAVMHVLVYTPTRGLTDDEAVELVQSKYVILKDAVEKQIAAGFNNACRQTSGRNMDYVCEVYRFPEPINKEVC